MRDSRLADATFCVTRPSSRDATISSHSFLIVFVNSRRDRHSAAVSCSCGDRGVGVQHNACRVSVRGGGKSGQWVVVVVVVMKVVVGGGGDDTVALQ
jgi:hypothetical protein